MRRVRAFAFSSSDDVDERRTFERRTAAAADALVAKIITGTVLGDGCRAVCGERGGAGGEIDDDATRGFGFGSVHFEPVVVDWRLFVVVHRAVDSRIAV
jgi:hypothetical protein